MRGLHQGERLLLLVNRSPKMKQEIAQNLKINSGHLSKLFKSEKLTSKIKISASELFGVDVSYFETQDDIESHLLKEPNIIYKPKEVDEMTVPEIMKYLEEKDRRHYEERSRLLAIIENLTKK